MFLLYKEHLRHERNRREKDMKCSTIDFVEYNMERMPSDVYLNYISLIGWRNRMKEIFWIMIFYLFLSTAILFFSLHEW